MSFVGSVHEYIHDYGYFAVSLGIALEDFGLPVPGETLLISGAVAAAEGTLGIGWLLLFAWAAAVVGDNIGFAIGHFGGHRLVAHHGSRVGVTSTRLEKVEGLFDRYGAVVIVFARFVILARQLNGIVAGTLGMHWARFLLFNAIGAALWVGFWGMLAYWLGKRVFRYTHALRHPEPMLVVLGIIAALAAGALAVFWNRRRRRMRARSTG